MKITKQEQHIVFEPEDFGKFQQHIDRLISQPHQVCLIDMNKVDLLDSSGLFYLVTNLSAVRSNGYRVIISNLQPSVRIIFELTQLDSVFEIC